MLFTTDNTAGDEAARLQSSGSTKGGTEGMAVVAAEKEEEKGKGREDVAGNAGKALPKFAAFIVSDVLLCCAAAPRSTTRCRELSVSSASMSSSTSW